jgi:hypothetical protein
MKSCFDAYAKAHPERAQEARFWEGLECSVFGVGEILEILEDYSIGYPDVDAPPVDEEPAT